MTGVVVFLVTSVVVFTVIGVVILTVTGVVYFTVDVLLLSALTGTHSEQAGI